MHDSPWQPDPILGLNPLWLSATLLVIVYVFIISERVNRAVIALLGAVLMVMTGVLDQPTAVAGIDFNTLALLIGMMVMVAVTGESGLFQFVAIWAAKRVKASPAGVLIMIGLVTALFSALLDNVTTALLITPITLLIVEELRVPALPYLIMIILSANIGGTATLIGDPPNILIGSATRLNFVDFIVNLTPVVVVIMALLLGLFYLFWGRRLKAEPQHRARVMNFEERRAIKDARLVRQSLAVLGLVMVGFVGGHQMGLEPGTVALGGAALLLLLHTAGQHAEQQTETVNHIFSKVEWVTIFFFAGLFILVTGVERAGLLERLGEGLLHLTEGEPQATALLILWSSAVLSAVLDNIPFVATMIPLIQSLAPAFGGPEALEPLWWALSLGACLGGNGSLIGASANLTVAAMASQYHQPIRFVTFLWIGFPVMLATVAVATGYLYLRYL